MKYFLLIYLILSPLMQASADAGLSFLEDPSTIDVTKYVNSKENCAGCAAIGAVKCPAAYQYMIGEVVKPSIYSWVVGNKIADICTPTTELNNSFEKTESILADSYNAKFHVKADKMDSCFSGLQSDPRKDAHKKAIASYVHGLSSNIKDLQKEKITTLASLDTMLGVAPLKDVYCEENSALCTKLRSCKPHTEQIDETVDFSMASLKELSKLDTQLNDLRRHRFGKQRQLSREEYSEAVEDIKNKIEMIKSMNPWFEGDQLKHLITKVRKSITNGNEKEAQDTFKAGFVKQLIKARETEKKEFMKLNTTQDCLENDSFCSQNILESMNKYYVKTDHNVYLNPKYNKEEIIEGNTIRHAGMCIAGLKSDKESMDELNSMVAGTVVGLAIGGAGGVLKLGQMALTFYKAGNVVKGVSSAGLLVSEGEMIRDSLKSVTRNCETAMNKVKEASLKEEGNVCSADSKNIYKVSDLKSCVVDIALTTLPYALSLRGVGKSLSAIKSEAEMAKMETEVIASKLKNNMFSEVEKEEIAGTLQRLDLTPEELEEVLKKMNAVVKTDLDKNRLKNYVNFVMSLKPEEQKLAMNELHDIALLSSNMSPGTYVQRFYAKENKFYLYEKYKAQSYKNDLIKAGKTEEQAIEASKAMARESRANLQKRFYSCQSRTMTPAHQTAAKRYMGVSLALGISGATYGNYKNNKDKYENEKGEWFSKLGYDIAMTFIMTKINAKFVNSAGSTSMVGRYVQGNKDSAMVGALDAVVYSNLYGVSEEEAVRRLEEIKNSPTAQKELKVLEAYLDKNDVAGKFSEKMIDDYKKILSSPDKETIIGKAPYEIGGETFQTLTPADLDRPEIKEKLVHALLRQLNSGENGPLITSGDKGADRWINDRVWNAAIGVPKSLVMGVGIYQVLCLGIDRPFASLGVVTGVQFANQFVSGDAYYKFRKTMIGQ